MIDEIPPVKEEILNISNNSKIVCYTDGLSDLKGDDGKEILTREIVRHITNKNPVETNIKEMLRKLGIPDNNPDLFDDVSIIAADFIR
jgi:sigma-B regulation protein RsbU (phosphoserine phosphatase)